jgi:phosphoadenosine phosphosulfate reductase
VRGVTAQTRDLDIDAENARLERLSPEERLAFAVLHFGDGLLFTSSFGAGSGVLLHLWSRVARHLPVVFIDTGFLFDETLAYRDRLVRELGLKVDVLRPPAERSAFLETHGDDIMKRDPDFCCSQNKIAPLAPLRAHATGWVSGLRRDQGETRAATPILLRSDDELGPLKIHPIATMTAADVDAYMAAHGVPEHPLRARRYLSIGCAPCTRAVTDGEDERAGRWAGSAKTECGLHSPNRPAKFRPAGP